MYLRVHVVGVVLDVAVGGLWLETLATRRRESILGVGKCGHDLPVQAAASLAFPHHHHVDFAVCPFAHGQAVVD